MRLASAVWFSETPGLASARMGPKATSAGRTMVPVSSIDNVNGTFVIPNSSTIRCAGSPSDGCVGATAAWNGRAASTSVSRATVTTVSPAGLSSSCRSCHPGRSKRQPHHDAHASSSTLRPRRPATSNTPPSKSGSTSSGSSALERTCPLACGPNREHTIGLVGHQRHVHPLSHLGHVEPAVATCGQATQRDAHIPATGTLPLQLPPRLGQELLRRHPRPVDDHRDTVSVGAAPIGGIASSSPDYTVGPNRRSV